MPPSWWGVETDLGGHGSGLAPAMFSSQEQGVPARVRCVENRGNLAQEAGVARPAQRVDSLHVDCRRANSLQGKTTGSERGPRRQRVTPTMRADAEIIRRLVSVSRRET